MATEGQEPEITGPISNENSNGNTKDIEKEKRLSLPVYTLIDMISFCVNIYTELGMGAYHDKEQVAEAQKLAYSSIKQKFSSAQEYGLLELKHRVGYKLTPLFLKIHKFEHQEERREGLIEALRTSEIYAKLIDDFNGHNLPSEQGLSSRLIRNFGVKDYAASKAAAIFISNLKDNGFVGFDNTLNVSTIQGDSKAQPQNTDADAPSVNTVNNNPIPVVESVGYIEIPVPLKGGKRAYLKIPDDYSEEDCKRIAKFVDALI